MNGAMMAMLSLCGAMFVCWHKDSGDGWKNGLRDILRAIGVYALLFALQSVLYIEVVLRWLVF